MKDHSQTLTEIKRQTQFFTERLNAAIRQAAQECSGQPVFVCADTAAARCEISRDTWDVWVKTGYVPQACIRTGQIVRWHWPSVEAALATPALPAHHYDPSVIGVQNVGNTRNTARARHATA
jgi:hypothetical protein